MKRLQLLMVVTTAAMSCQAWADEEGTAAPRYSDTGATNGTQRIGRFYQASEVPATMLPLHASKLMRTAVQNPRGEVLGMVRNLVVDWQNGTVPYAVIGSGGVMGLVPLQMLKPFPGKSDVLMLDISDSRWASAPTFHAARISSLLDEDGRILNQYYGGQIAQKSEEGVPTPTGKQAGEPREEGQQAGASREPGKGHSLHLASSLIDQAVFNRQNQRLGTVTDLMINWKENEPAVAIMKSGGKLEGGHFYAIPVRHLSMGESSDRYIIDADPSTFSQAPSFNKRTWVGEKIDTQATGEQPVKVYSLPDER